MIFVIFVIFVFFAAFVVKTVALRSFVAPVKPFPRLTSVTLGGGSHDALLSASHFRVRRVTESRDAYL